VNRGLCGKTVKKVESHKVRGSSVQLYGSVLRDSAAGTIWCGDLSGHTIVGGWTSLAGIHAAILSPRSSSILPERRIAEVLPLVLLTASCRFRSLPHRREINETARPEIHIICCRQRGPAVAAARCYFGESAKMKPY